MNKLIKKIKKEIKKENCDYNCISEYIEQIADKETFRQLKEQKIINKIMDKGKLNIIHNSYLNCWINLSKLDFNPENYLRELSVDIDDKNEDIDFNEEIAYLDFVIITSNITKSTVEEINKKISNVRSYNKISCLESILCWMNYQIEDIIENEIMSYKNQVSKNQNLQDDMSFYAMFIHELNAKALDFLYSGTRIITTIVNNLDESEFNYNKLLSVEQISDLYNFHAIYETNQYLIDKVAYGEFKVKSVDYDKYECKLGYINSQLIKVRYQQIKNDILLNDTGKHSILKSMFEEFAINYLLYYFQYCNNELKYKFKKSIQEIIYELRVRLSAFTTDDDLILEYFAENDDVIKMYSFSIILLSISVVNSNIIYMCQPSIGNRELFYIPLDTIIDYINEAFGIIIDEKTINCFTLKDKIKNSKEVLRKPFIMTKEGEIFGLLQYTNLNYWIDNIRNNLICGDKISNEIGCQWEKILESIFKEFQWSILGRGIILKKNGKTITDIDLLVIKDGVILIIQSKGIGECTLPYEYWKAKNTIEDGIQQALVSKKFLEENEDFFINILHQNKINYSDVKEVQAIVVTPNLKFSGWNDKNVAIISIADLFEILNETKNKYCAHEIALRIIKWFDNSRLGLREDKVIPVKVNVSGFDFYIPDIH